ncbi:MAG: hypothetical protein WCP46_00100 [Alphaproteobacteria bacterium]
MCTIILKGTAADVLLENEKTYINYLSGILDSCDELATTEITRNPSTYSFRIVCSAPKYSQIVLSQLLDFHNLLNIKLDLSKSIRNAGTINFEITLN